SQQTHLIYHSRDADFRRDRVRLAIEKFKLDEGKLLVARNNAAQQRAKEIRESVTIRIGVFSLLMGVLFLLAMRDSKKLRIAEQKAVLVQTRLETSLLQLQSESESSKLLNDVQADLQICASPHDAYEVAAGYLERLVPGSAGSVFAIDHS